MPPSQELSRLTTELHHATQGFRLMLWHFTLLVPIFDRLKEARELHKMVQESIPPLMAFSAEIMGTDWNRPRIPAATQEVFTDLLRDLNAAGISSVVSEWIMGRQPLAVEFHDFFSQRNIVGIFRKSENNFQIIFRQVEGSLKITYFLTAVIGAKLRASDKQERITYDKKPPRGLTPPQVKAKAKGNPTKAKDEATEAKATEAKELQEQDEEKGTGAGAHANCTLLEPQVPQSKQPPHLPPPRSPQQRQTKWRDRLVGCWTHSLKTSSNDNTHTTSVASLVVSWHFSHQMFTLNISG